MERGLMQGLWLPRRDITDWKIEFSDGQVYTRARPGPVAQAEVELDAIGCLSSGSIKLVRPRHPVFPAFSFTAQVSVLSRSHGWVPVALGFIPQASPDADEEYTLEMRRMEELTLDGYYDGSVVHNTLGPEPVEWNETNRSVVDRVLKRSPTASIGTDWAGRVMLARPEDGSPVRVSRAHFYDWKNKPDIVLPYLTAARWDGGPGWRRGEYRGIPRPPLTPERVQDAGEVKFEEIKQPYGMPVVTRRELTVRVATEGEESPGGLPGLILEVGDLKQPLGAGKLLQRVKGNQYAAVVVLDPQRWYEGSALMGQDNEEVKKLQQEVTLAQQAYALAAETLGEDSPLARQESQTLQGAQAQLRLARVESQGEGSDYEPLSALLPLGFEPHDVGEGIITGATMWLSTLPWDDAAVGPPPVTTPDPTPPPDGPATPSDPATDPVRPPGDPDAPLGEGEGIEGPAIVHPLASPATLQVFEAPMTELTSNAEGKPYQMSQLKIPESYFRGPLAPALAKLMDKAWRERYDPDEPPEGEEPPSKAWGGRWYLHVAVWWQAVGLRNRQVTGNWDEVAKLDRSRLAAVTTGPMIRTHGVSYGAQ